MCISTMTGALGYFWHDVTNCLSGVQAGLKSLRIGFVRDRGPGYTNQMFCAAESNSAPHPTGEWG